MAGAGFKTFASGEVLTAANVNTYLMQQTVMVFADSSARSTALGANVSEGMLSYLKDTNKVEVYDGSSWVASDDPNAIQNTIVDAKADLITATAADTPARLAVGTNGQVLTADSATATGLKWATPVSGGGTTWTLRNGNGNDGNGLYSFAFNGSNLYVAAGPNGYLYTSSDGVTWTSRTSGFGSNDIQRVAFGNGLFVAVGNQGTLTTSTDGITWTARTANMSTNTIFDVVYANSTWVAVGNGGGATNTGGVIYSTDGITWTRKSQSPTIGTSYLAVEYNGTNWIIGATLSTNNALYASDPSGTWTAFVAGQGNAIVWLEYDGTRTFACESTLVFTFSTSSTYASWTTVTGVSSGTTSTAAGKRQISYHNNKIHVINSWYYQNFATNNIVNGLPDKISTIEFIPSNIIGSGTSINTNGYCIFACSTGLLFGGSYQWIWTSF